ncbi:hypothetical protein [Lumpy skin disease virus]|uniref:LS130 n=1 Tax=Lumpy skin disease virus TaxID=59509 RepID=A0A1C9HHZ4_LSDV|nr:hypothetical protein [Lumpy skin disease virus]AOO78690.1 hypothetical protein [Lumpy skin disease virus]AOO78849.1 hypothetical protein [Lumpy skin disease virus]AOO79007.1 hypothetical protein [Lumpy skin disease virus]AVR51567.1 hypothetical protein [Lumpy skin disease virus]
MEELECMSIKITSENGSTISIYCESKTKISLDITTKKNNIKPITTKKSIKKIEKNDDDDLCADQENAMEIDGEHTTDNNKL